MFDFENAPARRGSDCVKWDHPLPFGMQANDVIPMWVADMDFSVAPFITDALIERARHGVFGYTQVPDSYYSAVTSWFKRRYNVEYHRDWIIYTTGVVPAISAVLRALTKPGDKVIIQTPVYNCFFSSIRNLECQALFNPLKYVETPGGFTYAIDFLDLEQKCADPQAKVLLLCNPHNPGGRVWTADELRTIGEIARRHGVTVISDEIHGEIVMPGHKYTPFAAASKENLDSCVTLCSPSKAFNIAGLQTANIIVKDPDMRERIDRGVNIHENCDLNCFGPVALQAAYTQQGEQWLSEMNDTVNNNYLSLKEAFCRDFPKLRVCKLEGTYLIWVDVRPLGLSGTEVEKHLLKYGVWVNNGDMYGDDSFIRINAATTPEIFRKGLRRILLGLSEIQ